LITLIDDAAKTRISQFFEEETTAGACMVLQLWIERFGVPQTLYRDHKNAFVLTREPTDAEPLKGMTKPKSHFGKAEGANKFLLATYLPKMNGTFSRPAVSKEDARVPLLEVNLLDIFCFEYERTVSNDYVVRFETRLFQILKENRDRPRPKNRVIVYKKLDGSIVILWNNKPLKTKEIVSKKKGVQPASRAA
jgi:hypothetical protein